MRPLLYLSTAVIVMALAFWAYRENYATQAALRELANLQDEIAGLREDIAMQRAEWAYLNRPARLKELATVNFDRLMLLPLEPEQLADGKSAAMPVPPGPATAADGGTLVITGAANTSGETGGTAGKARKSDDVTADPTDKAFP